MHRGRRAPAVRITIIVVALFLLPALVGAASGCTKTDDPNRPTDDATAPSKGTSPDGTPVFALPEDPGAAIRQANLPELPELPTEITRQHIHAHVDLEINGRAVTIPADIGIVRDPTTKKVTGISPLHTIDATGIAHIESAKPEVYTAGQLFAEWGVKLDKHCVATYCAGDEYQLLGFLNGELVGDPTSIPLQADAEVYIWFGKKGVNPKVASTYVFPPGL